MADEVKVPGVGEQNKKVVQVVVGAAAVFVAWRWYAARKASAAAATAAAGPSPLPVDTSNTGAAQGGVGYQNPGGPLGGGTGSSATGLSTNAAWTQKVEGDLANLGFDAQAVSLALGLYLSGQPLTLDQQNIVRTAWAYEGKPPESTNLAIIPAQNNPSPPPPPPPPAPTPEPAPNPEPTPAPPPPAPAPAPPPPDPHAGQHLQPPQVATLEAGRSLRDLARGMYGVTSYQPHLDILVQLNPGEGGPDHKATYTHLIRTSEARWVNN